MLICQNCRLLERQRSVVELKKVLNNDLKVV